MGKQSIPWAVGLTGLLYFGMLGYWQYDALKLPCLVLGTLARMQ